MIKYIKKTINIFNKQERFTLALLLLSSLLLAILELISVSLIMPFISIALDSEFIVNHQTIQEFLIKLSIVPTHTNLMLLIGCLTAISLAATNFIASLLTVFQISFSQKKLHTLSSNLFKSYLSLPYSNIVTQNTANITKNIVSEASRVITGIFLPLVQIITKTLVITAISIALLIKAPILAMGVFSFVGAIYLIFFSLIKTKLHVYGSNYSQVNQKRYKIVKESFAGFKELKIYGQLNKVFNELAKANHELAFYDGKNLIIPQVSRYIMESIIFISMIALSCFMLIKSPNQAVAVSILGGFAFAGFRILPQIQQIFNNFATMQYHLNSIDIILSELQNISDSKITLECNKQHPKITLHDFIRVENISYSFNTRKIPVLNKINLTIKANQITGFIGSTGSGKSTLINMLLGLIKPKEGKIYLDQSILDFNYEPQIQAWQQSIGYVPQDIFLKDGTILENLTFSNSENINWEKLKLSVKIAQIYDFIEKELPSQYNTYVGENGVQLSGGQKQRIGLARALYRDPNILVLDEATSALDTKTELLILESLIQHYPDITIIMIAHRQSSMQYCDNIFLLKHGKIAATGDYKTIAASSEFKNLYTALESKESLAS